MNVNNTFIRIRFISPSPPAPQTPGWMVCLFGLFAEDAAVKIQAVFRGHKVRTDMKQGDGTDADGITTTKNGAAASAAAGSAGSSSSGGAAGGAGAASNSAGAPSKQELEAEFREDDKGEGEALF